MLSMLVSTSTGTATGTLVSARNSSCIIVNCVLVRWEGALLKGMESVAHNVIKHFPALTKKPGGL